MDSPLIRQLLQAAVECGASDLLLQQDKIPLFRISGQLTPLESPAVTEEDLKSLWRDCGADQDLSDFDAGITAADGTRFRVNLLRQVGKRGAVLRRIRRDIPDLDSLGVPADLLRDWIARRSGIIIVSGPTGSGKSTTVAATLEYLNSTSARHVVTIEDPIEYLFESRQCIFTQREVGIDTPAFSEGLRRSLRQDPDVIFLGEIRDSTSALTAIQASETGHLVIATLHAAASPEVVTRLELMFPVAEREGVRKTLSSQLLGVLCQRLIPSASGGYALAAEFFANEGSSRKMIAEGRVDDLSDFIARGPAGSTRSLLDSLVQLVKEGSVAESTAMEHSDHPQELSRLLRGISSSSSARR